MPVNLYLTQLYFTIIITPIFLYFMYKKLLTFIGIAICMLVSIDTLALEQSNNSFVAYSTTNITTQLPDFTPQQSTFQVVGMADSECKTRLTRLLSTIPPHLLPSDLTIVLSQESHSHGGATSQRLQINCDLDSSHFTYTFLHELGHIHYFDIQEQGLSNPFSEIAPVYSDGIPNYLTEYATTNPHEDFAESFAMYLSDPDLFEEKAQKSPVLQAKYEFIQNYIENYTQPSSTSISAASSSV